MAYYYKNSDKSLCVNCGEAPAVDSNCCGTCSKQFTWATKVTGADIIAEGVKPEHLKNNLPASKEVVEEPFL